MLPSGGNPPLSFKKGSQLLLHCLSGPDAPRLAAAIDRLLNGRTEFRCSARTISLREIWVRGKVIGGNGVLYFQPSAEVEFVGLPNNASPSQVGHAEQEAETTARLELATGERRGARRRILRAPISSSAATSGSRATTAPLHPNGVSRSWSWWGGPLCVTSLCVALSDSATMPFGRLSRPRRLPKTRNH